MYCMYGMYVCNVCNVMQGKVSEVCMYVCMDGWYCIVLQCNVMQYNAMQYNAMQCDAMYVMYGMCKYIYKS